MRKRSKKRISQEDLPWVRVVERNDDQLHIFNKKVSSWRSGNRRNISNLIMHSQQFKEMSTILNICNYLDQRSQDLINNTAIMKFHSINHKLNSISKIKNFCLFLGKGRTYSRKMFVSRQILRKLMKTGLISGMQK